MAPFQFRIIKNIGAKGVPKISVKLSVDVNNTDGITSTDLAVSEKEIILRDKDNAPCKSYDEQFKESRNVLFSIHFLLIL